MAKKTNKGTSSGFDDSFLRDVRKRFGDNAVMLASDSPTVEVDVISTGSLTTDIAVGVGGLPSGRIVEIYGPESSGKCLTSDTYLLTSRGLETIAEMFSAHGQSPVCANKVVDGKEWIINENAEMEETSHFTFNNRRKVRRIMTKRGMYVDATYNHPIRVINQHGHIVWRKAKDIAQGDFVVTMRGTSVFGVNSLDNLTALNLGYLIADGTLTSASRVAFTNNDPVIQKNFLDWVHENGFVVKTYERKNTCDYHVNSVDFREKLHSEYGLEYIDACGKTVPYIIRTGTRETQSAFLRGYFDCECSVDKKRQIEVVSASHELLHQVQMMLLNFGISSSVCEKIMGENSPYAGNVYYRLSITGQDTSLFLDAISFDSDIRNTSVKAMESPTQVQTNHDSVPNVGGLLETMYDDIDGSDRELYDLLYDCMGDAPKANLTYERLRQLTGLLEDSRYDIGKTAEMVLGVLKRYADNNYLFQEVSDVSDIGEFPTFDVVMPSTHTFWSNGVVSHNTTLCLHVIANAQREGHLCAFVDTEHALDMNYAQSIGVQKDKLLISQPDTGEQALEITESLVRSGRVKVVVVDSVAALVPRAEIEGEMGDSHVGLQARLMSQALRKLTGAVKITDTVLIFTNQLREKIGVMFGCFHYNARVVLADGTTEKIGKIVNQKMDVEVMSYDVKTGVFEPRRIVNWFDNGNAESFLQFVVDSNEGRGRREFGVTHNHLLLTEHGYEEAGNLQVGDTLVTATKHYLSPAHYQVVYGSALGDGSLRYASDYNVQLRIGHGEAQTEYAQWKASLFNGLVKYTGTNSKGGFSFDTIPMYELAEVYEHAYTNGKKDPSPEMIRQLSPLAIAIWYMDNGTFDKARQNRSSICATGFPEETRQRLVDWFVDHDILATMTTNGRINFGVEATQRLHAMIARYVHPSMQYKLMPEYRGQFEKLNFEPCIHDVPVAMPIIDVYEKPKTRSMKRFDIEVEGNHCYLVDGVVVHNSPETTAGGRALKFYASLRLDIRRIQSIKGKGGAITGNRTRIKVKKNKVAPPFREAEFDIIFPYGISIYGEIVDLAVNLDIIEKRGAYFKYTDPDTGELYSIQGRQNTVDWLAENSDVALKLMNAVRLGHGLTALDSYPFPSSVGDVDNELVSDELDSIDYSDD